MAADNTITTEIIAACRDTIIFELDTRPALGSTTRVHIILDVSPSMNGLAIYQAKRLLKKLVSTAPESIAFTLARMCRNIKHVSGPEPPSEELINTILSLKECTGTNLGALLDHISELNDIDSIIIITDGKPTVGTKKHQKLIEKASKIRQSIPRPVFIPVGEEANRELLKELASRLGGLYVEPDPMTNDWNLTLKLLVALGVYREAPLEIAIARPPWISIKPIGVEIEEASDELIYIPVSEHALTKKKLSIAVEFIGEYSVNDSLSLPMFLRIVETGEGGFLQERVRLGGFLNLWYYRGRERLYPLKEP